MRIARFRVAEALRRQVWLIPLAGVGAGIGLSFLTTELDRHHHLALLPSSLVGTVSDAQDILTTIASSIIPLTTTVLTVTLVAVQLAMGQFSPRIVQALMTYRGNQAAIAIFGATFSFSLLSLRATGTGPGARVPSLTIWTAIALVVVSGAALFFFVNHAARRLRVGGMIDLVGDELRKQLDRRYPTHGSQPCDPSVVTADRAGNVIHVDEAALVEAARRVDCTLELVPVMGDFVVAGAPLFRVGGDSARLDRQRLRRLIVLGDERTHRDDPAYGFRKLADVAQRALGASNNDATTAVQVINRLHDCLRQIAPRPFPSGRHMDENGRLRLVVHLIDWDGYVRLAFDEIRLAAGPYPQATRRLRAALEDLKTVAPPERQASLDRQLRLLRQAVEHDLSTPDDIRAALVPDQQGLGSGVDVTVGGDSPGSADPIADASAPRS